MPVALERRALTIVGEVIGLLDLEEFCKGLLRVLREAIPAEFCALNEVPAELPHTISLIDPPVPAEFHLAFARHALQNPLADHFMRTGEGRATRFSDLITRRQLHRLELYREVYGPLGVEYQIAVTLPSGAERLLGIALSRGKRDFTAAECRLLNLSRPYLIQAYRNALAHTALARAATDQLAVSELRALGLTKRQAEVLRLTAMGRSSQDAAAALGISMRTVQKHLEHCYQTLDVDNRSAASRIAWAAAEQPGDD
jgi:DNA-binding CsgD family transcriptional regulator